MTASSTNPNSLAWLARSAWRAHAFAGLLSLLFNLQLRWAGQLGFYQDDFNKAAATFFGEHAVSRSWVNLIHHFLTDEPLFNVYLALRWELLGFGSPLPHHLFVGTLAAVNATLAFSLIWRLSRSYGLAFIFLFLFATYPGLGEAYYWVATPYIPMLFALLAGAHFWLTWLRREGRRNFAAAWLLYSIAIFTHEAAFGFLVVYAAIWFLERPPAAKWRPAFRSLAPLVASNAAYLAVRQTAWFGLGNPGFLHERPLSLEGFFTRLMESVRLNFGDWFFPRAQEFLAEAWPPQAALFWFAMVLAAAVTVSSGLSGSRTARSWRWEGFVAALGAVVVFSIVTSSGPPGVFHTMRVAIYATAAAALAAWVGFRLGPARSTRRLAVLGAFAAIWFFSAFAPTYVYYFSYRHNYLPAVGSSLLIAVALWLPQSVVLDRRLRRFLQGAALALTACLSFAFHGASRGEVLRWADAHARIEQLRIELLASRPSLPDQAVVVILDTPDFDRGVPLLSQWGLYSAVQLWYGNPSLQADSGFLPREDGFTLGIHPSGRSLSYDRLVLFGHEDRVLKEKRELLFRDGARVVVGNRQPQGEATTDAALPVVAGELVRHTHN